MEIRSIAGTMVLVPCTVLLSCLSCDDQIAVLIIYLCSFTRINVVNDPPIYNLMPQQRNDIRRNSSGATSTTRAHEAATSMPSNHANSSSIVNSNKRQMQEQLPRFSTILVARSNNTRPSGMSLLFWKFNFTPSEEHTIVECLKMK